MVAKSDMLALRNNSMALFLPSSADWPRSAFSINTSLFGSGSCCDRDEPICAVPLKGPGPAITRNAAVEIVGQGASYAASLAGNLVHVVWRRCGGRGRDRLGGPVARAVVAVGVLLDQRVGAVVLSV